MKQTRRTNKSKWEKHNSPHAIDAWGTAIRDMRKVAKDQSVDWNELARKARSQP